MKNIFIICLLLIPFAAHSQKEGNIWYFGYNAGIDFNSGSAVSISGPINTWEGCADICDDNGDVLFSTDGITVFDKNDAFLTNGLKGNPSTTQSGVIVPSPASPDQFYIFTASEQASPNGINYNIIDMTLNGGLGQITSLNNQLLAPSCEKITAALQPNGKDVWVIVHAWGTNEFYAYPLTSLGVGAPVITGIGSIYPKDIYNTAQAIGQMKMSPDGKKIASSMSFVANQPVEVFDFDNATGKLSNQINLPTQGECYGISFSKDNSKIYCAVGPVFGASNILQFDMSAVDIPSSKFILKNNVYDDYGSCQLAPDGKIYIAKNGGAALDVINFPNEKGISCGYVYNGFPLQFGASGLGLPNFLDNFFGDNCTLLLGKDTTFCGAFTLTLKPDTGATSYVWQDGSGNETFTATTPGKYYVTAVFPNGCTASDTIQIDTSDLSIDLYSDTTICRGTTVVLHAGAGYSTYTWSNGSNNESTVADSGSYSIIVTDVFGCEATDTIEVHIDDITVSLGNDFPICAGATTTIDAGAGYETYLWQDGSTDQTINVDSGNYNVIVTDVFGCTATDDIFISLSEVYVSLGIDTAVCNGVGYLMNAGSGYATYLWMNGTTDSTLLSNQPGIYSVIVTNDLGCAASDSILIGDVICDQIFLPIAFSPNQDGTNDSYHILNAEDVAALDFNIYNRWGQLIFTSNDATIGWNGKYKNQDCDLGVYIFVLNGVLKNGIAVSMKGNVTLVR